MIKGLQAEWGTCYRTVSLGDMAWALACYNDYVAVSHRFHGIIVLNMIAGNQVAVLSGHTDWIKSLTFSLDGTLLVSGSWDKTVKLWDIQTGGVIKTYDHTSWVLSVSISPDSTTLASGCCNNSIHLWGVWTGVCFCIINGHIGRINSVSFSPTNSQHLISASSHDHSVKQWDINGSQMGPACEGNGVAFSLDGSHFVSWGKQVVTIHDSKSGAVITKLQVPSDKVCCCCFSPSGELMAAGAGHTIYVWDITCSDPHFKTLVGHTYDITALIFSSSLVSVSFDGSVKFWQIGTSSADSVAIDTMPNPSSLAPIKSVSLQLRNGIAISSDSEGVVKTWDILTGHCKASFQTPAKGERRDAQLIEDRLILVWYLEQKIHIWDTEKGKLLQTVYAPSCTGLRISGDGSKVFCVGDGVIQSWSIWTGEGVGEVESGGGQLLDPLIADGSRIWVSFGDSSTKGWDFGISDSSPVPLSNTFPIRPYLDFIWNIRWWSGGPCRIRHTVTGRDIFQLAGRYAEPDDVQWDGQFLVAGYVSGEVLILDFNRVVPQ